MEVRRVRVVPSYGARDSSCMRKDYDWHVKIVDLTTLLPHYVLRFPTNGHPRLTRHAGRRPWLYLTRVFFTHKYTLDSHHCADDLPVLTTSRYSVCICLCMQFFGLE